MPRLPLILAAALCLLLTGCRFAAIPMPGGKTAWVSSCLTDPAIGGLKLNADGSVEITAYASKVNAEAVKAAAEGVTAGVVKGLKP